jgi:hypothetical protein
LLNDRTIKQMVRKPQPGIFLLHTVPGGQPRFLGRDDRNVRDKLLKWLGRSYRYFQFDYCETPEEAFRRQCELYHQLKQYLDNTRHPERPDGTDWRCPLCDFYK